MLAVRLEAGGVKDVEENGGDFGRHADFWDVGHSIMLKVKLALLLGRGTRFRADRSGAPLAGDCVDEVEKGFRRISAHKDLPYLEADLERSKVKQPAEEGTEVATG